MSKGTILKLHCQKQPQGLLSLKRDSIQAPVKEIEGFHQRKV